MAEPAARRLPRGRHPLSREEVEADQRLRILVAVADTMSAQGYVNTPVADIISSAGVSRATYYSMFSDKLDAFLAAFDFVGEMLVSSMTEATGGGGTPLERVERAMDTYLGTIAAEPRYARLFLIEVYAAGPEAIRRRHAVQARLVDDLVTMLGAGTDSARFACQVIVASMSAMLVGPLVAEDPEAVLALGPPMLDHIRRLIADGIVTT